MAAAMCPAWVESAPKIFAGAANLAVAAPDLVAAALAKHKHASRTDEDFEGWLTASWDPTWERVVYGCKHCVRVVQAAAIKPPCRYRDSTKCNAFMHGNLHKDLEQSIMTHPGVDTSLRGLREKMRCGPRLAHRCVVHGVAPSHSYA